MSSQLVSRPSIGLPSAAPGLAPSAPLWRRAALRVWQTLEAMGHARASSELNRLAVLRLASDPQVARLLRQTAVELEGR